MAINRGIATESELGAVSAATSEQNASASATAAASSQSAAAASATAAAASASAASDSADAAASSADTELAAIRDLTAAANKGIYYTGSTTAALFDLTAQGRAILDDADAAAQRTTLGLGTAAVLATGISDTNVAKFTSGVADDDFLRVDGTAIEGRSASEVLSDIGAQAALTFGISNTNSLRANANVADDDFLRVDGTSIEGRTASEVLSDIGGQAALTFGISNTNTLRANANVVDDDFLRVDGTSIEGRSASEVLSDIGGQAALTFGISNTNTLRANANVVDNDFLRVDGTSIEGRSASEVLSDIGALGALTSDGASLSMGDDSEITLTHVADTGITLTNTVADTDNRPMVLNLKSEEDEIVADDVIGSIRFTGGDSGGTDAVLTGAKIDAIATDAHASDNNSTALTFSTGASEAATEKVRITPNGNLLANTTSASAASVVHELRTPTSYDDGKWALKVIGTSTNTDGTGPYGLWINYANATPDNNSTNDAIFFSDATAARFMVISSGDFWSSDGGWVDSDETLKENITDASSKLADVLNLKVRNFNWKSSHHPDMSDKKMIGFIAQEMESVFPNLVNEHDINPQGKDGTPNMKKGIKTTALIPILTKAIQELSAQVTALEARVNTLEG